MNGTIQSEHIENRENSRSERIRFLKLFAVCVLSGAAAYLLLIANELTNTYDGLWEGSFYSGHDYRWVVSIGRWFWPFVGELRKGFSPEPFTSLASLALIAGGSCLAVRLIGDLKRPSLPLYLTALCTVICTAVCCRLSYRYMSPTFGASFLLSIWAVDVTQRKGKLKWLISAVMLVLSLALYQTDIGCACFLILLVVIRQLMAGEDWKTVGVFFLKAALLILCSCVVYKLLWELVLIICDVKAVDYNGAATLSLLEIITRLPERVVYAYRRFFQFFSGSGIRHNAFQSSVLFRSVFVGWALTVTLLCGKAYEACGKTKVLRAAAAAGNCLLIPLAANVSLVLAPDSNIMPVQMTMPIAMTVPVLIGLGAETVASAVRGRTGKLFRGCFVGILILVLYGNFLQVSLDQHNMLQSRTASLSLMERVIADLEANGYTEAENEFIFMGSPVSSREYQKEETWQSANAYAHYGDFLLGDNVIILSYNGLLRDGGFNLKLNQDLKYWKELDKSQAVRDMPAYPQKGYAKYDENHNVIVKIS